MQLFYEVLVFISGCGQRLCCAVLFTGWSSSRVTAREIEKAFFAELSKGYVQKTAEQAQSTSLYCWAEGWSMLP